MKKIQKLATYLRIKMAQHKNPADFSPYDTSESERTKDYYTTTDAKTPSPSSNDTYHMPPETNPSKADIRSFGPEERTEWPKHMPPDTKPNSQVSMSNSWVAILNIVKCANALGSLVPKLGDDLGYDIYSSIEEKDEIKKWLKVATDFIRKIQFGGQYLKRKVEESGISETEAKSYKSQLLNFLSELRKVPMVPGSATGQSVNTLESALNSWNPVYIPAINKPQETHQEVHNELPQVGENTQTDKNLRDVIYDKVDNDWQPVPNRSSDEISLMD